ncbi:MAG: hypothetical protein LUC41_00870, partial [Clostridiales bacterium]|nr:hypothetical protein [Clostridiales bacterium]
MKSIRHVREKRILAAVIAVALAAGLLPTTGLSAFASVKKTEISRWEQMNPVYSETVDVGTDLDDLELPSALRAIISLDELGLDTESFVQSQVIQIDDGDEYDDYDYYSYGYVAPQSADDLYAAGETVIYSIYYADEEDRDTVGDVEYRVYGSIDGYDGDHWFTCDEDGDVDGVIVDVDVDWEGDYDGDEEGEYTFSASEDEYDYSGEDPTAVITVEEPIDETDDDLDEYLDSDESSDSVEEEENEEDYSISLAAADGDKTNDELMNAYWNVTTSGNEDVTIQSIYNVAGTWRDYCNTMWANRRNNFSWTDCSGMEGVSDPWTGETATGGGLTDELGGESSADTNPLHLPYKTGTTWQVYSGEQLLYALTNAASGDTVQLEKDIDLNGEIHNWVKVTKSVAITIDGQGHTIYNLGIFAPGDSGVASGATEAIFLEITNASGLIVKDINFETAKLVGATNVGLFMASYTGTVRNSFTDITIADSVYFSKSSSYYSSNIDNVTTCAVGGLSVITRRADYTRCGIKNSILYGAFHTSGLISWGGNGASASVPGAVLNYCYGSGNTVICVGGHSAMLFGCGAGYNEATHCYSNGEMYGSVYVGGIFAQETFTKIEDCF